MSEIYNQLRPVVAAFDTRISETNERLEHLEEGGLNIKDEVIEADITAWLDEHPEATTTVQDESLTYSKLVKGTLNFVTPEMFGAVGDGVTDDSTAINSAIASGFPVWFDGAKVYAVSHKILISNDCILCGNGSTILEKNVSEYPNGYSLVIANSCKFIADGLTIIGDRENTQSKQTSGIDLTNCYAKVTNLTVKGFTSHLITVHGGASFFNNITLKYVGSYSTNYCFVYATDEAITTWDGIYIENDVYDSAPQGLYLASGHHTITNIYTKNVNHLIDARNGTVILTNGYQYHGSGIICQTSGSNEGADITISNVIFDDIVKYATDTNTNTSLISVNAVKRLTVRDCIMRVSSEMSENPVKYLVLIHSFFNVIENIVFDNLQIIGDGLVYNPLYVKNMKYDADVTFRNCRFPTMLEAYYAGAVYDDCVCKLVFENTIFKTKPNNKYVYDVVNHGPYKNVVVKSLYKSRGETTERPVLWRNETGIYYDETLGEAILWNGTAWTKLDGSAL